MDLAFITIVENVYNTIYTGRSQCGNFKTIPFEWYRRGIIKYFT